MTKYEWLELIFGYVDYLGGSGNYDHCIVIKHQPNSVIDYAYIMYATFLTEIIDWGRV